MKAEDCRTLQDVWNYGYGLGNRPNERSESVIVPRGDGTREMVSWMTVYDERTPWHKAFMQGFKQGCPDWEKKAAQRIVDRKAIRRKFAHARSRTLRARGW